MVNFKTRIAIFSIVCGFCKIFKDQHGIRPSNPKILAKYSSTFKPIQLFAVSDYFGSSTEAQKVHFNDGGQFDKLYTVK